MIRKISKSEFQKEIHGYNGLSLVKFFSEWSGACQVLKPAYEELAITYETEAKFFSVDVETDAVLLEEFGIRELPTIIFFRNGKIVDHVSGLISKNALTEKLENNLISSKIRQNRKLNK